MRVLLIDVNCKTGSTGQIVYNLYSYLNNHGDEATVCYGRGEKIEEKNIFKFGLDWETNVHAFLTRITGYTGRYSFFSTRRLIKYIENFKPDIVHIHEMHAYFLNIKHIMSFLAEKNIKTIFTLHCEFDYTGKCGHSIECEKWKQRCGECSHLRDYPSVLWFDHTADMHREKEYLFNNLTNATITTVSPWLSERAKQSFLKNKKIYTIYNGVDSDIFHPRDTSVLKRQLGINLEKVIISVAPHIMSEEKGGHYIVQIASRMRDCLFILIGTDEKYIRKDGNILYVPKINDHELLATYYSLGDVFVICSKKETFSLTCAEALNCGTPIAGFKCGAPEMVFQKPYAIFVEYGDIDFLERAIKEQLDNRIESIDEYGRVFSSNYMISEYIQLYNTVANQDAGRN